MNELYVLLKSLPQITGPLSLIAFLSIIFYLVYQRSVKTDNGLEHFYDYLRSISPKLGRQEFFRVILLLFLLILIIIFLLFLFLLELSDISLYVYFGIFLLIFLSFLFFAYRMTRNVQKNSNRTGNKVRNKMTPTADERNNFDSLLRQKATLEKSLQTLEEKKARYGMDVPLNIQNEIDYIREQLNKVIVAINNS